MVIITQFYIFIHAFVLMLRLLLIMKVKQLVNCVYFALSYTFVIF